MEVVVNECGLKAFLKAHDTFGTDFMDLFMNSLITIGGITENYIEFFTVHFQTASPDSVYFLQVITDTVPEFCKTPRGKKVFIDSGVLRFLLKLAIEQADSSLPAG